MLLWIIAVVLTVTSSSRLAVFMVKQNPLFEVAILNSFPT
jgi:hypothetical protein